MNFERNVKILIWQGFFIGLSFWAPIQAIYYSTVSGSYTLGLSIFSIAMVSSAIFEVPTGVFSDLIGRKYTTMMGGLCQTLSCIFYAIGLNYGWLVVGAALEGLGRSFYSGNNDALFYDSLNKSNKKEELEKFMGHVGGAEQWALGISALLGGIIAAKFSIKLALWISVIPLFLCFLTSWWLVEVKNIEKGEGNIYLHLKEAVKNFLKNEKLRLISLIEIIGSGLGESAFQFQTVFIAGIWPPWAIGLARTMSNIGAAIGFNLGGKIINKYKAINILLFENVYSRVVNIAALLFPTIASPAIMSTTSFLYGPSSIAESSMLQKEFSDKQRATMGSLNSVAGSIFFGIAALGLGMLADKVGPRIALIWASIIGSITIWLTWKLKKLLPTTVEHLANDTRNLT